MKYSVIQKPCKLDRGLTKTNKWTQDTYFQIKCSGDKI
jgi:hypothetical protein